MGDLAAIAHQHAQVADAARGSGNGSARQNAQLFSFKQLLQGSVRPSHSLPFAPEMLRISEATLDRGHRSQPRVAEEAAERPRNQVQAKRSPLLDDGRDSGSALPARDRADDPPFSRANTDRAGDSSEGPTEHTDRHRSRALTHPTEADAGPPASGAETAFADVPINILAQPPCLVGHDASEPAFAASANRWPAFMTDLVSAAPQHAVAAPAPTQGAVSIVRDADILLSQPGATLAPTAAIAAENLQGQEHRLGPSRPGLASGTKPGAATPGLGGVDGPTQHGSQNSAMAAGAGSPQAGQNNASGQAAAMLTAAGGVAIPPRTEKFPTFSSTTTASDARAAPGIAALGAETTALGGAQTAQHSTRTASPEAPTRAVLLQQRIVSDQVSVHIRKALQEGVDRIEIRLKPEALGRVDVRLELGSDNRVVATVTVDQRHTLELLRADARSLERALQEAGLQTDGGSLNFNLRSGDHSEPNQHEGRTMASSLHDANRIDSEVADEAPPQAYRPAMRRPDGIDIEA